MVVRTRFAPSPTGFLHVGGARTALYAYLFARHHKGQFILRIEDTDLERSTQESIDAIIEGMHWLGLDYDKGPYRQTDRMKEYHAAINLLLEKGLAYRCNCSKERLEALRESQMQNKEKPRYDSLCREKNLSASENNCVIRFKNPQSGFVEFDDLVYGKIRVANEELDDLIIARSDGSPTYNFTVVVDDYDMQITHVIRGDDHINNTPRQINILQALNAPLPQYAHLPMILGDDGKRLSKRHGAVSVLEYKKEGYLPQALLNYLVRLGWSCGDQEIFSLQEMIDAFDLTHMSRSAASFNTEKLRWLNQQYLKTENEEMLLPFIKEIYKYHDITIDQNDYVLQIFSLYKDRIKTLKEFAATTAYFFEEPEPCPLEEYSANIIEKFHYIYTAFEKLSEWNKTEIHNIINETLTHFSIKMPELAIPLRLALTGSKHTPSIDTLIAILGKTTVLHRLNFSIERLSPPIVRTL